jgi:SAM-dependent methyltransferase
MESQRADVPQVTELLRDAEALEARAATERVAFLTRLFGNDPRVGLRLLDVGCGNGYSVAEWNDRGLVAVGVDVSLYRLSRWIKEHPPDRRPFVIADAAALPFVERAFDKVVSSGMIEHVGVSESSAPYTITPDPDQSAKRRQVIAELARVAGADAIVLIDCPNGSFPIDFWHGDGLGAFRIHGVPDVLLPSYSDLRLWAGRCDARAVLRPLTGRLAFRQVGSRWWGRALAPMMRVHLRILDTLTRFGLGRLVVPLYPYLVIEIRLD